MYSCESYEIFKNTFFKGHVLTTECLWDVFLENILLLKVCLKYKDLQKLANIQGAEEATRRYTIKSVFKNCTKFTGKSICWSLSFNKVARMSTATLLKRDPVAGVFL